MKINKDNCGIYKITSPSGNFYIGSSYDIRRRTRKHINDIKNGVHDNICLQNAANKYGVDNLLFETIILCNSTDLLMYEQICIDGLGPKYNICKVAGSTIGVKKSALTKKRMSESALSPEGRLRRSIQAKGRLHTEEAKQKISNFASSANEKIRRAKMAIEKFHSPDAIKKRNETWSKKKSPVLCVELKITFLSVAKAVDYLKENGFPNAATTRIHCAISGRVETKNGYTWKTKSAYGCTWKR